jgi:hypothetical protein
VSGKYLAQHRAQEWGDRPICDPDPEPWKGGAAAPFLWIERAQANVEVWALGEDRFRITAAGHEQLVTGLEEAQQAADALAQQLRLRARAEG